MRLDHCSAVRNGPLLVVTIRRPEVMNALHEKANRELVHVFDEFADDPECAVAIITGAGEKAFCAGKDLKDQAQNGDWTPPPAGFGGLTGRFDLKKPVIAAVNGIAAGGGFEIALACDLIIASERASFILPEPRVGLVAVAGGLLRLPQQVPLKRAMEIILTGRRVTAEHAATYGFVNAIVPADQDVLEVARRWAAEIQKASPLAIQASKDLVARGLRAGDLEALYAEQKALPATRALYASGDPIEGPRAFSEKRAPRWAVPGPGGPSRRS